MSKLKYILTIIISIFIGCGIMYGLIFFFPTQIVEKVTKEEVEISDTGINKSVEKVYDAVVYVTAETNSTGSTGTGFVYKKTKTKGYIITNYHVVSGANSISITFSDDTTTTATLVGGDEYSDIAVLTVDAKTIKDVIEIGDNSKMEVGDTVFAVGAPLGIDYKGTVTKGILSGKDRLVSVSVSGTGSSDWVMNVMQTDAAINPGNSGGPLCNINGEVIGITSMKIVQTEAEGLGFAIPIEEAIDYANEITTDKKVQRPYIGVQTINAGQKVRGLFYDDVLTTDTDIDSGAVVVSVEKNSPAEEAGIKVGDVIVKIGKRNITNVAEFRYYLYKYNPKDTVEIVVNRNKKEKTLKVKLIEKES